MTIELDCAKAKDAIHLWCSHFLWDVLACAAGSKYLDVTCHKRTNQITIMYSNHQLALAAAAVVATVVAVGKNTKKIKKKQQLTSPMIKESTTTTNGICSSATKSSSYIQSCSGSATRRRESIASSLVSSCISVVSSLLPKSDRELKRATVLDAIQYICTESNDNQQDSVLQDIHKALEEGDDKLEAVILSSGNGSYSFIVFVENRPELCLYAELLTFGENMEQRAENEWANMRRRYSTPLGRWDVVEEEATSCTEFMKLLVSEWSNKKTQRSESKKTS